MEKKWVYAPILVILAVIISLFILLAVNQPKTLNSEKAVYEQSIGKDEYLDLDYISPEEEGIGDFTTLIEGNLGKSAASLEDCESQSDFEKEWCYVQYASDSGDIRGCDIIGDVATKDSCYGTLAIETKNAETCNNIIVGKAECIRDVAIETNNASLCEKTNYEHSACIKAVSTGNYADCSTDYQRDICNNAVTAGDASLCEEILDRSEYCYYEIALNTDNAMLCNKAGVSKDHCFFAVATTVNNPAICENLSETRDNCVAWIAFNTNNKQLCFEAGSEVQSCLEDLS
ncbi:MAG: hypothetical protein COV47_04595 [Candidatus Diapherotrites archaeon CG11_big_fil_rev_8_21_14_0_20_37_9]|nr:MAG: hypothetical protein COV47_04595 [Candidatus Diapherotrites archaeon CG11_big_fil_rev_8_21_14_0_20_37_9]